MEQVEDGGPNASLGGSTAPLVDLRGGGVSIRFVQRYQVGVKR